MAITTQQLLESMKIDIDGTLDDLVADEDTTIADYADAVILMLQKHYMKDRF